MIDTNISLLKQIVFRLSFGLCFGHGLMFLTVNALNLLLILLKWDQFDASASRLKL